jgi:hypothetical protein
MPTDPEEPPEEPTIDVPYTSIPIAERMLGRQMATLQKRVTEMQRALHEAVEAREEMARKLAAAPVVATPCAPSVVAGLWTNVSVDATGHAFLTVQIGDTQVARAARSEHERTLLYHSIGRVVKHALDAPPFNPAGSTRPTASSAPMTATGVAHSRQTLLDELNRTTVDVMARMAELAEAPDDGRAR